MHQKYVLHPTKTNGASCIFQLKLSNPKKRAKRSFDFNMTFPDQTFPTPKLSAMSVRSLPSNKSTIKVKKYPLEIQQFAPGKVTKIFQPSWLSGALKLREGKQTGSQISKNPDCLF